jgi:flagellar biosynthesis/type III secretory pathway ATPase
MMEVLKHDKDHLSAAGQLVSKRAILIEKQDIIAMARDEALKDPKTADALKYEESINSYLKQGTHDKVDFDTSSDQLKKIFK